MRRLILFALLLLLAAGSVPAASAQQINTPTIVNFTTPVTVVNRINLRQRLIRMPVAWQAINRPLTANLFFEQILPDGSAINVELPRPFAWVNSSGDGVAAPIEPPAGVNAIVLRVTLRDLFSQKIYSERQISVPIGNTGAAGSDAGFVPTITRFTASTSTMPRAELQDGRARIGVTWQTMNRPITSTLVFEQVLGPGNSINVELPRPNPWVNTSGMGIVAPIDPGDQNHQIQLRLRFVDKLTGRVHDQRDVFVSIINPLPPAMIRFFEPGASAIDLQRLQQGIERIPVNWAVDNRPPNSNLVFEQILPNNVVNVELPRSNPIVPSNGPGVLAPIWPGGAPTYLRFQARLIDLGSGAVYDRKEIALPVYGEPPAPVYITHFGTSAVNVNMGRLISASERVPVTWALDQRPPNTNLIFEQRLPDGSAINVELPRPNPIVPSSGSGAVLPVWPGSGSQSILLVMRLVNLTTGVTIDAAEIRLPIVGVEGSGIQYGAACFNAPYGPNRGFQVGDQARVVIGDVGNGLRVRNLPQGDFVETLPFGTTFDIIDGPACWAIQTFAPGQSDFRVWRIRTHQHNLEAWVEEYRYLVDGGRYEYYIEKIQPGAETTPIINNFFADPSTVQPGGTTTLSWNTSQAARVSIQVFRSNGQEEVRYDDLPAISTLSYTVNEGVNLPINVVLTALSPAGLLTQSQNLTLGITCPFGDVFLPGDCPAAQTNIDAAYQLFQNGFMVWRADTRQIYVLFNDHSYQTFADTWTPDQPFDNGETPPDGLILPARGFGKVWSTVSGIREQLGWATGEETSFNAKLEIYSAPGQANVVVLNIPDGRTLVIGVTWQTQ